MRLFKKKEQLELKDIKVGDILKFTNGYHIKKAYYAEVIEVGDQYFITSIPDYHTLKISLDNNWEYHSKRMEYMGIKSQNDFLLYNQTGLKKNPYGINTQFEI